MSSDLSRPSFVLNRSLCQKVEGLRPGDLDENLDSRQQSVDFSPTLLSPLGSMVNLNSPASEAEVEIDVVPRKVATTNAKQYLTLKHRGTSTDLEGAKDALKLQESIVAHEKSIVKLEDENFRLRKAASEWEITENILRGQLRSRIRAVNVLRTTLWQDLMGMRAILGFRDERLLAHQREKAQRRTDDSEGTSGVPSGSPTTQQQGWVFHPGEFTYLDAFKLLEEEPDEDGNNLQEGTRQLFTILKMEFEHEKQWIRQTYEDRIAGLMLENRQTSDQLWAAKRSLDEAEANLHAAVADMRNSSTEEVKKLIEEAERHVLATEKACDERLDEKDEHITELNVRIKELEEELGYVKSKVAEFNGNVSDAAGAKVSVVEEKLREANTTIRERDLEAHRAKTVISQLQKERSELQSSLTEAEGVELELQSDLKALRAEHTALQESSQQQLKDTIERYEDQISDLKKVLNDSDSREGDRVKREASRGMVSQLASDVLEETTAVLKEDLAALEVEKKELQDYNTKVRSELQSTRQALEHQTSLKDTIQQEYECLTASHELLKSRIAAELDSLKVAKGKVRPMVQILSKIGKNELDASLFALDQLERMVPEGTIGADDFADTVRRALLNDQKRVEVGQQMLVADIDEHTKTRSLPPISDARPLSAMIAFEFGDPDSIEEGFSAAEEEKIVAYVEEQIAGYRAKRSLEEMQRQAELRGSFVEDEEKFEDLVAKSAAPSADVSPTDSPRDGPILTAKALGKVADLMEDSHRGPMSAAGSKRRGPGSVASGKARSVKSAKSSRSLKAHKGGRDYVATKEDGATQTGISWVEACPTVIPGKQNPKVKLNVKAWMFDDEDEDESASNPQASAGGLPLWRLADAATMTDNAEQNASPLGFADESDLFSMDANLLGGSFHASGLPTSGSERHMSRTTSRRPLRQSTVSSSGPPAIGVPGFLPLSQDEVTGPEQQRLPDAFSEEAVALAMDYVHRGISQLCADSRERALGHGPTTPSNQGARVEDVIHRWFGLPVNTSIHPFSERQNNSETLSWLYRKGETIGPNAEFLLDVMEMRVFALMELVALQRDLLREGMASKKPPLGMRAAHAIVQEQRQRGDALLEVMQGDGVVAQQDPVHVSTGGQSSAHQRLLASRSALHRSRVRSHLLPAQLLDFGAFETRAILAKEDDANSKAMKCRSPSPIRPASAQRNANTSTFQLDINLYTDQTQSSSPTEVQDTPAHDETVSDVVQFRSRIAEGSTIISGVPPCVRAAAKGQRSRPSTAGSGSRVGVPLDRPTSAPHASNESGIHIPGQPDEYQAVYLSDKAGEEGQGYTAVELPPKGVFTSRHTKMLTTAKSRQHGEHLGGGRSEGKILKKPVPAMVDRVMAKRPGSANVTPARSGSASRSLRPTSASVNHDRAGGEISLLVPPLKDRLPSQPLPSSASSASPFHSPLGFTLADKPLSKKPLQ